ncbi:endonuclease/exonuclease/phosphatase family protein [Actinoplanes sp. NPDC049265]|uniref:endonuclease/exonuclease/phosphatase family protein n=1 Tax=Actinoplanes sp. NPDC049265 TaxID=3363902 RepID=UPI0037162168
MLRVATFNVNNLFSRWSFAADLPRTVADAALPALHADSKDAAARAVTIDGQAPGGDIVRIVLPDGQELTGILRTFAGRLVSGKDPKARSWIARRIAVLDADVLCLQEVEDQDTLDTFGREDLAALGVDYPYRVVIEGNDPRRIDVAICSRRPIERISSWRYWADRVFSRDLLQVAVEAPDGKSLNIFVNHLKSNFVPDEFALGPAGVEAAHAAITARRTRQSEAIAAILRRQRITKRAVVLGDLNDIPTSPALSALARHGLIEQISRATTIPGPTRTGALVEDRFAAESATMWTHRHRADKKTTYSCYDQVWTTDDLPVTAAHVMRRTQISGDGSDHDPACVDLAL